MRDHVIKTLLDLVSIDSDVHSDKEKIIDYTMKRLEEAGLEPYTVGTVKDPAIIASYGTGGILFSGHLDTVPIGSGWTKGQGEIVGDRIYGRGTADMKGDCAAVIDVAEELVKDNIPFSICFTTDEEEQMHSTSAAVKDEVVSKASAVLIGEPTGLCPAYREKGVFRFRLTTNGKAAHASQPWLGKDAVLKMHSCIERLRDMANTSIEHKDGVTMVFSTIHGGTTNNVVSDHCTTEIDVRFPLPQTPQDIELMINEKLRGEDYRLDVEYTLVAFESDPHAPLTDEMSHFLGTPSITVPYATEAPKYAAFNPRVFICGPGDVHMAHITDEYVERTQIYRAYDLLSHMARYLK